MFLAGRYVDDPRAGLLSNTSLDGDNVYCGTVLGVLLGLASDTSVSQWFGQLTDREAIDMETQPLLAQSYVGHSAAYCLESASITCC
jgi:hypothetical protein